MAHHELLVLWGSATQALAFASPGAGPSLLQKSSLPTNSPFTEKKNPAQSETWGLEGGLVKVVVREFPAHTSVESLQLLTSVSS